MKIRKLLTFLSVLMLLASTASAANIILSGSESYTAQNGDVLTGSTSGTVTIANNAKITLSDVTITYGIICKGNATITLVGTNNVSVPYLVAAYGLAGIQVGPANTTLTIRGNGSLNVDMSGGWGWGSAIGTRCTHYVVDGKHQFADQTGGNIVIEGGVITAKVKLGGAGIGTGAAEDNNSTGYSQSIGSITINGGSVTAIGGEKASGIGKGHVFYYSSATIGAITIYDNVDFVDASSISESVTYMHDKTDVTANKADYFSIIENGDRRVIAPKDNTDYSITIANGIEHGTLTGATTAKYMEKVTITATPALGYRFSRLVVKNAQNNDVESTANSFFMPKSNVTVSAVFEQGTHGTKEFVWGYSAPDGYEKEATIYDGVTTVNLPSGISYTIGKDYHEDVYGEDHFRWVESRFSLDNDISSVDIPYAGGTGEFAEFTDTQFKLNSESGFYDITLTDVGNGKWSVSILKTVGVIDNIPDQTYTGSEIKPEPLVMAGSLNLTKGTDYVYSYTNNTNAGTATVRATFRGTYASLGYVEKTFTITPKVTTLGALTLTEYGNRTTATIQGEFTSTETTSLEINDLIEVSELTFQRTFTAGVPATVMLPFSFAADKVDGKFYTLASVAPINGVWTATMSNPINGIIQANTPYIFKANSNLTKLTFENGDDGVTLQSTKTINDNGSGDWTLHGVYEKTRLDDPNQVNYGFAGQAADGISVGDFIRAGDGVWADPMRCYLTYTGIDNRLAKSALDLPDNIRVVFPDEVEQPDNGEIVTPVSEFTPENGVKVWSFNGTVYIDAQPDMDYTIVDLTGRTIKTGVTHSTHEEVNLNAKGIVIVKIGNKSFKLK